MNFGMYVTSIDRIYEECVLNDSPRGVPQRGRRLGTEHISTQRDHRVLVNRLGSNIVPKSTRARFTSSSTIQAPFNGALIRKNYM